MGTSTVKLSTDLGGKEGDLFLQKTVTMHFTNIFQVLGTGHAKCLQSSWVCTQGFTHKYPLHVNLLMAMEEQPELPQQVTG